MNSFWRIFSLEFTAFVRSKSLAMLLAASAAWMLVAPFAFRGDGTAEGARQLALHYSLGGVAALLAVSLLASATGSIARERAERRLQLTIVRPVRYMTVALAKIAALSAAGALVLGLAAAIEAARSPLSRPCSHLLSPVMQSPREEALEMYEAYMRDPSTPDAVRKAKKSVVLRLLAQRSFDRYETVQTNGTATWRFTLPNAGRAVEGVRARMRFTNLYGMRQDVAGRLVCDFGDVVLRGDVGNVTQAVVEIPLEATEGAASAPGVLAFRNDGGSPVMLRPRRDVNLLVPADGFAKNLARAYVELVAMLALLVSFGVFLGSALGRPVALFTAIASLAVAEMSPSVIEQYSDELENDPLDAIGLCITRAAAEITHPVSSLDPMSRLAEDVCIEPREVARVVLLDMLLAPLLFALLASVVIPRKTGD